MLTTNFFMFYLYILIFMIRLGQHLEFISISGPTVDVPLATPKGFPQTPGPSGYIPTQSQPQSPHQWAPVL